MPSYCPSLSASEFREARERLPSGGPSDPLSRTFQQRIRAIEFIWGGISPTGNVRFRKGGTVREEVLQGIDNISNVYVSIVVAITGIQASNRSAGTEEEVRGEDGVGHVVSTSSVTVAANETVGQDMNLPAFRVRGKAKTSDHGTERRRRNANLLMARANQSIHTLRARITYERVGGDMEVKSLARREDFYARSGDHGT